MEDYQNYFYEGAVFLVSPLFLVLHIANPELPISFGTDIGVLKGIIVLAMAFVGVKILTISNKIRPRIFSWSFVYIVKSIKFKVINFANTIR